MDEIRPWLYIGKYRDTKDRKLLAHFQIQAMLQFAEEVQQPGIETLYLPVEDGMPIANQFLEQGIDFILTQKDKGHSILIACGAGMSRSSSFGVIALIKTENLSLLDALKEVKSNHPDTMIHPVLWTSLCKFSGEQISYLEAMKIMTADVDTGEME